MHTVREEHFYAERKTRRTPDSSRRCKVLEIKNRNGGIHGLPPDLTIQQGLKFARMR